MYLQWERIFQDTHRAPAPLFGSIRVEDHGTGKWMVNWSVPGFCDRLLDRDFETAREAIKAAEAHVDQALKQYQSKEISGD